MALTPGGGHLGWFHAGRAGTTDRWIKGPVLEWMQLVGEAVERRIGPDPVDVPAAELDPPQLGVVERVPVDVLGGGVLVDPPQHGQRLLVGRAMRSDNLGETLLTKRVALPVFASDALSSVAYAPDEILLTLGLAGVRLARKWNVPHVATYHTHLAAYTHYVPGLSAVDRATHLVPRFVAGLYGKASKQEN